MNEAGFWKRVAIAGPDECWPWTGHIRSNGYGSVNWKGQQTRAHRVAYLLTKGDISPGLYVCHACDNRPCCNPAHLWEGTAKQNHADGMAKGRIIPYPPPMRGSAHPFSKLTEQQALELRALHASGIPYSQLALMYGISKQTAWCIGIGRSYPPDAASGIRSTGEAWSPSSGPSEASAE